MANYVEFLSLCIYMFTVVDSGSLAMLTASGAIPVHTTRAACLHQSHRMPQMYSMRSRLFCITGSWKNGTLGAVRGTSTLTYSRHASQPRQRSELSAATSITSDALRTTQIRD